MVLQKQLVTSQGNLNIRLKSPLDEDALIVQSFVGQEGISQLFEFSIIVHSSQPDINFEQLLGKPASVCLTSGEQERYFSGVIGEIEQGVTQTLDVNAVTFYRLKLVPTFWLAQFNSDHRIFMEKSTEDIVTALLSEYGVTQVKNNIQSNGKDKREFCVQYGESAFHFISRLLEEEGIFYYFEHSASGDTLVLADANTAFTSCFADPLVADPQADTNLVINRLLQCQFQQRVVVGSYATADYNFETASTKLYSTVAGQGKPVGGKVYSYPGRYQKSSQGDDLSDWRLQALEWGQALLEGATTVPAFLPGGSFTVTLHPREEVNQAYVVYRVTHRYNRLATIPEEVYQNEFTAFVKETPFRAPLVTPKPRINSNQTAIVTGKSGEEIYCDEYGRITVQFYWDQKGKNDENSSCWIRVAQSWAHQKWGSIFTPRIGQEVVITFLDGDPDRPLVIGCVYNSDNEVPYPLPDDKTRSGWKTNTSLKGEGFNELSFEDKKGEEEIFFHAQKDMNTVIEDSRTLLIKTGDDTSTITQGDRTVTLTADKGKRPQRGNDTLILEKGNRTINLNAKGKTTGNHTRNLKRGDDSLTIKKGSQKIKLSKGDQIITLTKGQRKLTLSSGNETISITGTRTLKITKAETHNSNDKFTHTVGKKMIINADELLINVTKSIVIKSGQDMTLQAGQNINIKAGQNIAIKGGMNIEAKAGLNFKAEGGVGVELKGGATAKMEGGAAAEVKGGGIASIKGGVTKIG